MIICVFVNITGPILAQYWYCPDQAVYRLAVVMICHYQAGTGHRLAVMVYLNQPDTGPVQAVYLAIMVYLNQPDTGPVQNVYRLAVMVYLYKTGIGPILDLCCWYRTVLAS